MKNLSLFSCMFLILFTAKVFGYIVVSWWIITAPIWAPFLVFIGCFVTLMCLVGATEAKELVESNIKSL